MQPLTNFLVSTAYAVVAVAFVLGVMILVHEFGHYAVAKLCGVRVEVFSLGFGKRLFGFRRGDTDYRVSLLPVGGYVKMAGEKPPLKPPRGPGEVTRDPPWARFLLRGSRAPHKFFLFIFIFQLLFIV